ncbi:hypothetical protein PHISCL_07686 [Aspergillus sclerotialis]|uniref:Uncharacterized protein n=1 Tax=Aspergillus sclerotialis TaxID=2070753 RepID=A0A3A2ZA31_9EURO|nr:hypothetical protein PHISCL_07686 [Aspergillus sclerotialis]
MAGIPELKPAAGSLAHSVVDRQPFMERFVGDGEAWRYDHTATLHHGMSLLALSRGVMEA